MFSQQRVDVDVVQFFIFTTGGTLSRRGAKDFNLLEPRLEVVVERRKGSVMGLGHTRIQK